jgi:hypothetical protein
VDYTQIEPQQRLTAVQARIRDLEGQYMNLELRVQAPDVNTAPGNMDTQNLGRLEASLTTLHTMEAELRQQINAGPANGGATPIA